jgi:hypothetical protein
MRAFLAGATGTRLRPYPRVPATRWRHLAHLAE